MKRLGKDVLSLLKWSVLGIAVGTIVGAVTSGSFLCIKKPGMEMIAERIR